MQIIDDESSTEISRDQYTLIMKKYNFFDCDDSITSYYFENSEQLEELPGIHWIDSNNKWMAIHREKSTSHEEFIRISKEILLSNDVRHFVLIVTGALEKETNICRPFFEMKDGHQKSNLLYFYCVSDLGSFKNIIEFSKDSEGFVFERYWGIGDKIQDSAKAFLEAFLPSGVESEAQRNAAKATAEKYRVGDQNYLISEHPENLKAD